MGEQNIDLREYYRNKYMPYQMKGNCIADLNPLIKVNLALVFGIIGLVIPYLSVKIAICVFYCIIAAIGKKGVGFAKVFWGVGAVLFIYLTIIRQLSVNGKQVLFSIFGWDWTVEGFQVAIDMTFSLIAFSGGILLFFYFTELRDFMYTLERKGVSHVTSYVVLSSMQTIKDLKKTSQTIMDSQKARGVETEGNFWHRMKALIPLLSPLFLSALASTEEKTIAMDARAFSVEREHTFLRQIKAAEKYEVVLAVLSDIVLLVVLILKIMGKLG